MRKLCWFALGFVPAVLAMVLVLGGRLWWLGGIAVLLSVFAFLLRRPWARRAAIALLGGFLGLERLDMRGMLILIAFLLLVVQTLHSMERGLTAVGDAAALVWKRLPRKSKAEKNY